MSFEQTERSVLLTEEQVEGITSMLDNLASSREMFGLRGVRFADLVVKGPIPTYRYVETGVEYVDGLYALCSNHGIIALLREGLGHQFFAFFDDGQALGSFLSGDDVSGIALVGDADGLYVYGDSNLTFIASREADFDSGFASISDDGAFTEVSCSIQTIPTAASQAIAYSEPLPDRTQPSPNGYYYLPSVPFCPQEGENYCWAACTSMIYAHYSGTLMDPGDIVGWLAHVYGYDTTQGGYPIDVKYCLDHYLQTNQFRVYEGHPTFWNAYICIESGVPFAAFLQKTRVWTGKIDYSEKGHAVTVFGYNPTNYYLCYWDPAQTQESHSAKALYYYNYNGDTWYYTFHSSTGYVKRLQFTVYRDIW